MLMWILMFMGKLPLQDAMPLSRVVVSFGALVSLALNVGRHAPDCSRPLIDWCLVKMICPMALLGTLIGAMIDDQTPCLGVLVVLVLMMCGTLLLLLHRAQQQHLEEVSADEASHCIEEFEELLDNTSFRKPTAFLPGWGSLADFEGAARPCPKARCSRLDVLLLVSLTVVVVTGGVLQRHIRACFQEQQRTRGQIIDTELGMSQDFLQPAHAGVLRPAHAELFCHHPVLSVAFWGYAEVWLASKGFASTTLHVLLAVPVWACFATTMFFVHQALRENWSRRSIATYLSVGLVAGVLTSFGICGGLIFSPFFLLVGIDPNVAIATSSTCVVFTSSCMALQYFFIDRIQLQLAIACGAVNAAASLCGTSLAQHLGECSSMKKSYMTLIVAFGLAVSITVSAVKGAEMIQIPQSLPTYTVL